MSDDSQPLRAMQAKGTSGRRGVLLALSALTCTAGVLAQSASRPLLRVGPNQALRSLASAARQARDGFDIEVEAGDYVADVAVWRASDLRLRAVGGRVRLIAGGAAAENKGIFVTAGERISIEGFDFIGARAADAIGSGIRLERGTLHLRDCSFRDCEMGLLTANNPAIRLEVENCEFSHAALRPGNAPAHLLYAGSIGHLSVSGSYFHHGRIGHLLKSRAAQNFVAYNRLTDEIGGRASYELEFPNGGLAVVLGNLIQQSAQTENPHLIAYGVEGLKHARNELYLVHNTLIDKLPEGGRYLRLASGATRGLAVNNLLVGGDRSLTEPGWDSRNNLPVDWDAFVQAARDNYVPRPGSALRGRVVEPGPGPDGLSLRPARQYRHPHDSEALAGPALFPGALQQSA